MKNIVFFTIICIAVLVSCGGENINCDNVDNAVGTWKQEGHEDILIAVVNDPGPGCGEIKVLDPNQGDAELYSVNAEEGLPAYTPAPDPEYQLGLDVRGEKLVVIVTDANKKMINEELYIRVE